MSKETVEVEVFLEDGKSFKVLYNKDKVFSGDSLTDKTLHTMKLKRGGLLFVQGDKISCIVSRG